MNGNNSLKFHDGTMIGTQWKKMYDRQIDDQRDGQTNVRTVPFKELLGGSWKITQDMEMVAAIKSIALAVLHYTNIVLYFCPLHRILKAIGIHETCHSLALDGKIFVCRSNSRWYHSQDHALRDHCVCDTWPGQMTKVIEHLFRTTLLNSGITHKHYVIACDSYCMGLGSTVIILNNSKLGTR